MRRARRRKYPGVIAEIKKVKSARDLMDIVGRYNCLVGKENNVFLVKAQLFENHLSECDWANIYCIAEEGSELEKVAREKAGDALDFPEPI